MKKKFDWSPYNVIISKIPCILCGKRETKLFQAVDIHGGHKHRLSFCEECQETIVTSYYGFYYGNLEKVIIRFPANEECEWCKSIEDKSHG